MRRKTWEDVHGSFFLNTTIRYNGGTGLDGGDSGGKFNHRIECSP